ncbi:hypothetical protein G6F32_015383 [Rhizopus arrhizus]|nr:hypothetical protein G6F32_015383 [Rhizopus arrhizus]
MVAQPLCGQRMLALALGQIGQGQQLQAAAAHGGIVVPAQQRPQYGGDGFKLLHVAGRAQRGHRSVLQALMDLVVDQLRCWTIRSNRGMQAAAITLLRRYQQVRPQPHALLQVIPPRQPHQHLLRLCVQALRNHICA